MVVNWRIYNESLVRRSETVLDFDIIDNLNIGFSKMNDERSASRRCPDSFVRLLGYMGVSGVQQIISAV